MNAEMIIYPKKESKLIEFKEKLTNWNKIIKTCVAFANGAWGDIVIGVQDRTRIIVDISEKEEEEFYESIPNKIFDMISPSVIPDLFEKNFGEKNHGKVFEEKSGGIVLWAPVEQFINDQYALFNGN